MNRRDLFGRLTTAVLAATVNTGVSLGHAQGRSVLPGIRQGGETARERLNQLLRIVPAQFMAIDSEGEEWHLTWVDLRSQLAAFGSPSIHDENTTWPLVTGPLISTDPLFEYGPDRELKEDFGYLPFDAHEILSIGSSYWGITIYSGGINLSTWTSVWESTGYAKKSTEYGDFWTVSEEGQVDYSSLIGMFGGGRLLNAAVVQDQFAVFTTTADMLHQVQALHLDGGNSIADSLEVENLVRNLPSDAVNVALKYGADLEGTTLAYASLDTAEERTASLVLARSNDAVGFMPPVELALFGVTAGVSMILSSQDDLSEIQTPLTEGMLFALILLESNEAALAGKHIIQWRFHNMRSPISGERYSGIIADEPLVEVPEGQRVVRVYSSAPTSFHDWNRLKEEHDFWPFAWLHE